MMFLVELNFTRYCQLYTPKYDIDYGWIACWAMAFRSFNCASCSSHYTSLYVFVVKEPMRCRAPQLHLEYRFYKILGQAGIVQLSNIICLIHIAPIFIHNVECRRGTKKKDVAYRQHHNCNGWLFCVCFRFSFECFRYLLSNALFEPIESRIFHNLYDMPKIWPHFVQSGECVTGKPNNC